MLKILSIGNSYSEDATAMLTDVAGNCKDESIEIKAVNLYIGGCPLELHAHNLENDLGAYLYQVKGKAVKENVKISDTVKEDDWNIVTFQQASGISGLIDSYYPYINTLSDYIKTNLPNAQRVIFQTWAYEHKNLHPQFESSYGSNQQNMFTMVRDTYKKVADGLGFPIIPCGEAIQYLRRLPEFDFLNGGQTLCNPIDGFHMHWLFGRYAIAGVWTEAFGGNFAKCTFIPEGASPDDEKLLALIRSEIHEFMKDRKIIK